MQASKLISIILLFLILPASAAAGEQDWIAVLVSDNSPVYSQPLETFTATMDRDVKTYTLTDDIRQAASIRSRIQTQPPTLIFALGARAAFAAKLWTREQQDIPVVFAMVFNWQKYHLLDGQTNVAGISTEINPGNQFLNLSIFAPGVKKVGVIYSPNYSQQLVDKARKATEMLGMELITRSITSGGDFRRAYKELVQEVDGIWVLNDPITYTLNNMDWLKDRCIQDQLACIGQSDNLVEAGMLLSVRPDIANIGTQAASMAHNIIDNRQPPSLLGVMEPLGTTITVNRHTADRIGLQLNDQALGMATEVLE